MPAGLLCCWSKNVATSDCRSISPDYSASVILDVICGDLPRGTVALEKISEHIVASQLLPFDDLQRLLTFGNAEQFTQLLAYATQQAKTISVLLAKQEAAKHWIGSFARFFTNQGFTEHDDHCLRSLQEQNTDLTALIERIQALKNKIQTEEFAENLKRIMPCKVCHNRRAGKCNEYVALLRGEKHYLETISNTKRRKQNKSRGITPSKFSEILFGRIIEMLHHERRLFEGKIWWKRKSFDRLYFCCV